MPVNRPDHQRRLADGHMADHDHTKPMSWGGNRTECGNDIRQFRTGGLSQSSHNFP